MTRTGAESLALLAARAVHAFARRARAWKSQWRLGASHTMLENAGATFIGAAAWLQPRQA